MSFLRLIFRSLLHHWRVNLAAAAAVAVGTTVLTGALLVGDSMRSSLRRLSLERLGRIEESLVADRFFREELADELAAKPEFSRYFTEAVPAVVLRGSVSAELELKERFSLPGPPARGSSYDWQPSVPAGARLLDASLTVVARGESPRLTISSGPLNVELFGAESGERSSSGDVAFPRSGPVPLYQLAVQPGPAQSTATLLLPADTLQQLVENGRLPWKIKVGRSAGRIDSLELELLWRVEVQANRVQVVGCDERFWRLGSGGPKTLPQGDRAVVNTALAQRLAVQPDGAQRQGVQLGARLVARLPRPGAIPAESALGRKQQTVRSASFVLGEVIPTEGLGRFGLRPTQHRPLCLFVGLDQLQRLLEQPGKVNALLVAGKDPRQPAPGAHEALQAMFTPAPADLGISVEQTERGYFNITSDRLVLSPAAEQSILDALGGLRVQPALTYLANTLACGEREIPYSTVTAIELTDQPPLGPLVDLQGQPIAPLAADQIVLNQWAAEQLGAEPGEKIELRYFAPETRGGRFVEHSARFTLAAVARLEGAAADPALTPEVPGVTDKLAMGQWEPPFPFDARRVRPQDEAYWEQYRATPKAFVNLQTGRRLWASRFGRTTSLRVPPQEGVTLEGLRQRMKLDPAAFGLLFQPVKRQALEAAKGTTSFSALFLGFSFFVIVAAVMLVGLLCMLAVEQRARQIGMLLALGWTPRRVGRLLRVEGLLVALVGSVVGVPAGVGYAALMLYGLRTWWLAAVVTPFLRLAFPPSPLSLMAGMLGGLVTAMVGVWWAMRKAARRSPRLLLTGETTEPTATWRKARPAVRLAWLAGVGGILLAAGALGFWARSLGEQAQAGAFFGAGFLVLAAGLAAIWAVLRYGMTGPAVAVGRGNLARLALRNLARIPARSTLTVGLVASAGFLIVSVSAFRLDPRGQRPRLHSGNGGFALVGESDQPIYHDLSSDAGLADLGFSESERRLLAQCTTIALRVRAGEDASCLNLYRPRQPRILGLPQKFIDRGGFLFADHLPLDPPATNAAGAKQPQRPGIVRDETAPPNPWRLLQRRLPPDADGTPRVPVILEKNTANYSLHLWKGVGQTLDITDEHGRTVRLVIVGLLSNSIFQGDLLISEQAFLEYFPGSGGYRFWLVETPPEKTAAVQRVLERNLADYGFGVQTTGERLAGFLAVQNTYLSTFQSLGGLGLLLGTFGLGAVQLRNVFLRRGELALMRAAGFRRATLARMVLIENALLLAAGLLAGVLPAAVAVLPHLLGRGAGMPFGALAGLLGLVVLVGLVSGAVAVGAVVRAPLLAALREEK